MPLYEYFCQTCNGVFEELRPMRESSDPVPCPQCFKDAPRIMPTSFTAFTFREGYPRRIPDDGKYYHMGQKVTQLVSSGLPNEHPEINKKAPKPKKAKGEVTERVEMEEAAWKGDLVDSYGFQIKPKDIDEQLEKGHELRQATPRAANDPKEFP
ncbi:MAG TPA: zinc ribbon domain-containing protein [Tepidiformaceae bacterium]